MTGSTWDLILIAVVVVIVLAAWIVLVFYADAHSAWRRPEAPGHGTSGQAPHPLAGPPEHSPDRALGETRTSPPPGRDTGVPAATLRAGKPPAARAPARAVPS